MDKRFSKYEEYFHIGKMPQLQPRQAPVANKESNKKRQSVTEVNSSTSRTQSKYSFSRLNPMMAAAMLSLPWPPPDAPPPAPLLNATDTDSSDNADKGKLHKPKSTYIGTRSSRKLFRKQKKSKGTSTGNREADEERDYAPFRIPKFHEVQTCWPGFEHEPIPNWKDKYMVAKPYPKKLGDLPANVLSQPSYVINHNETNNNAMTQGVNQSRSRTGQVSTTQMKEGKTFPRSRLHIERIGSCIK